MTELGKALVINNLIVYNGKLSITLLVIIACKLQQKFHIEAPVDRMYILCTMRVSFPLGWLFQAM